MSDQLLESVMGWIFGSFVVIMVTVQLVKIIWDTWKDN